MTIPIYQVDAFTSSAFSGNPAAICLLTAPQPASWMQAVALEMNLSETAFLVPEDDAYQLRWFTPCTEVDLCGHATLASAHTLWTETGVSSDRPLQFRTKSGLLQAARRDNLIELDFPAEVAEEAASPPGFLTALGIDPAEVRFVGRNRMDYLVEVATEDVLRAVSPNYARLVEIDVRGTIVTSRAVTSQCDFVSRFFAPRAGVNEDPVTGSAHCCLGPYWQRQTGQHEFVARQLSARGGVIHVRVADDRVLLGGTAVTVLRGQLAREAAPA